MSRLNLMLLLLPVALMISGCWDRHELNELGIVVASGIDRINDKYELTSQVVVPSAVAPGTIGGSTAGGQSPIVTISSKSKTLLGAIHNSAKESPRRLYFPHDRVILIGEDTARAGVSSILDFMIREPSMRETTEIMIVKGKAKDLMGVLTSEEKIPGNTVKAILDVQEEMVSSSWKVPLTEFGSELTKKPSYLVLPGITVWGQPEKQKDMDSLKRPRSNARIRTEGMAVFKESRMVGWLDGEQGMGLGWIRNKIQNGVLEVPFGSLKTGKSGFASFVIQSASCQKRLEVKNNRIYVTLNVKVEGDINEIKGKLDLSKKTAHQDLEHNVDLKIKHQIESAVRAAQQQYRADILGVGELIHRNQPKTWAKLKNQWNAIFPSVIVTINVETSIQKTGMIGQTTE